MSNPDRMSKKQRIETITDYVPNKGNISQNTSFLDNYNVYPIIKKQPLEKLQSISKKLALPVHLMLMNLDGNANIAMSIRTATVLGCSDVWIVGKMKYDQRAAVGANQVAVAGAASLAATGFNFWLLNLNSATAQRNNSSTLFAIDTTVSVDLIITGQLANATDSMTLNTLTLELI